MFWTATAIIQDNNNGRTEATGQTAVAQPL